MSEFALLLIRCPGGSYLCSQCHPIICIHGGCPAGSYLEIRLGDLDNSPLYSSHLSHYASSIFSMPFASPYFSHTINPSLLILKRSPY